MFVCNAYKSKQKKKINPSYKKYESKIYQALIYIHTHTYTHTHTSVDPSKL
jgi:hypothetical protein